jgi:hypothetical protein
VVRAWIVLVLSWLGASAVVAGEPAAPTLDQIRGAKVRGIVDGKTVKLRNGIYEGAPFVRGGAERPRVELLDTFTATGNLDDTPAEERVVLLTQSTGGSGVNLYLAVFGLRGKRAENLGTVLVGDRTRPSMLTIGGGMIFVDVVETGPGDASCCPTHPARKSYRLRDDGLSAID